MTSQDIANAKRLLLYSLSQLTEEVAEAARIVLQDHSHLLYRVAYERAVARELQHRLNDIEAIDVCPTHSVRK